MWQERALRVRGEIAALAAAGAGVSELHAAAIGLVDRVVSTEMTCWAAIDPETLVISSMTNGGDQVPIEYEPRLAEAEYAGGEPHTFAGLAREGHAVATLSDLSDSDRNRSTRLNNVWRPLGLTQELRVVFAVDGVCWGAAGMVRAGGEFTDREIGFLAAVAPAVGAATRLAVRSEANGPALGVGPAIVVVGSSGELQGATPAAGEWRRRFDEIALGRFLLIMQVMTVGARGAASGVFRARIRDARGRWAALHASPLIGGDDQRIAVVIGPATGDQVLGMLFVAFGFTAREREVSREVIAGYSTADIAARLFISPHTVQDHLKSAFAKAGVRSRGELVARLRPDGAADSGDDGFVSAGATPSTLG